MYLIKMENSENNNKRFSWKLESSKWLFGLGTSPDADWKIIFVSTIILAILMIALNVFIFVKLDKQEVVVSNEANKEHQKVLDLSELREVILYYQNKALEFNKIKNSGGSQ